MGRAGSGQSRAKCARLKERDFDLGSGSAVEDLPGVHFVVS